MDRPNQHPGYYPPSMQLLQQPNHPQSYQHPQSLISQNGAPIINDNQQQYAGVMSQGQIPLVEPQVQPVAVSRTPHYEHTSASLPLCII